MRCAMKPAILKKMLGLCDVAWMLHARDGLNFHIVWTYFILANDVTQYRYKLY